MRPTEATGLTMTNAMRVSTVPQEGLTSTRRGRVAAWPWRWIATALLVLPAAGCSLDALLQSDELPKNVSDPKLTQTPEGARAAYYGALSQFRAAFGGTNGAFAVVTGELTDEVVTRGSSVDLRQLPDNGDGASLGYTDLQKMRGEASQAIGLLTQYLP